MTNAEYAAGLRQLADLIEKHPELQPGFVIAEQSFSDRESFLKAVSALKDGSIPGNIIKKTRDYGAPEHTEYICKRRFGGGDEYVGVEFTLAIKRSLICTLVKPAEPAVYDCPDSLLEEAKEYTEAA